MQSLDTLTLIQQSPNYDPAMPIKPASTYTGRHVDSLREAALNGELKYIKGAGRSAHLYFRLSALNEWLAKQER